MLKFIKFYLIIFLLLSLNGCYGPQSSIEADDFGQFFKAYISASGQNVKGLRFNQFSEWTSTTLVVNGGKLVIAVIPDDGNITSAWSTWFGINGKILPIHKRMPSCVYKNNLFEIQDGYTPCSMRDGVGLYMAVIDNQHDPNSNESFARNPTIINGVNNTDVLHLGFNAGLGINAPLYHRGFAAGGYNQIPPSNWLGKRLYFKILDRYYTDNAGGYQLLFKNGFVDVQSNITLNIVTPIINTTKDITQVMFVNLLNQSKFIHIIKLCLTLFVIINFLAFTLGMVRSSVHEVIGRVFKVGLVAALLSPAPWDFFFNNFFTLFLNGTFELTGYLTGTDGVRYDFFEPLLNLLLAKEIWLKLVAVLTSPIGFFPALFYMCLLLVAMIMFLLSAGIALATFLLAVMGIALLIMISPFFIIAIIFGKLKYMFDNWLKLLVSYSMQLILVILFFTFVRDTAITCLQDTLGYRVTWKPIIESPIFTIWGWKIDISDTVATIDVPGYFINSSGVVCGPYECQSTRYVDLPFLIPDGVNDRKYGMLTGTSDQAYIDNLKNGGLPSVNSIIKLVIIAILTQGVMGSIGLLAQMLGGLSFSFGQSIGSLAEQMDAFTPMKAGGAIAKSLGGRALKKGISKAGKAIGNKIGDKLGTTEQGKLEKLYKQSNSANRGRPGVVGAVKNAVKDKFLGTFFNRK